MADDTTQTRAVFRTALEARTANRMALRRGCVLWTRQTVERGFVRDDRDLKTSGEYRQWWDGGKVATRLKQDMTYEENGEWKIRSGGHRTVWNGNEMITAPNSDHPMDVAIKKSPKYRLWENYQRTFLLDEQSPLDDLLRMADHGSETVDIDARIVQVGPNEYIEVQGRNKSNPQEKAVYVLDPRKAYGLVSFEWHDAQGRIYAKGQATLIRTADGAAWVPDSMVQEVIDPDTNNVHLHHRFQMDVKESKFNAAADIPKAVFTIPIGYSTEISDYRGGARLNYDQDIVPLAEDKLRQAIGNFLEGTPLSANQRVAATSTSKPHVDQGAVVTLRPDQEVNWTVWGSLIAGIVLLCVALTYLCFRQRGAGANNGGQA